MKENTVSEVLPQIPWNIYWINLDRRPDRRIHMEHFLKNNKHYRISAIDSQKNLKPYKIISSHNLRFSQYGCTISHIVALNYYINNKDDTNPYCFISEDDCYGIYCQYWKSKHYELLQGKDDIDILQMCTTSNDYDDPNLNVQNKNSSCTAFYMIHRNIAHTIVNAFLIKPNIINFDNSQYVPITDNIIWKFSRIPRMIPMISLSSIDENASDISPNVNKYTDIKWETYFKSVITKYLN